MDVDLSLPQPDGNDYGGGLSVPQLFPRRAFTIDQGSDLGPGKDQEVDGVAGLSVVSIDVTLADGSRLTVHPRLAPPQLRRARPWIRHLRFYVMFFPAGPEARSAVARDRAGRRLVGTHVRAACR